MSADEMRQAFRELLPSLSEFELILNLSYSPQRDDFKTGGIYRVINLPEIQRVRVFAQGNQDCGFCPYGIVENWFFDAGSKIDGLFIDEWLEQNLGFDLDRNTMEELL